MPVDICFYLKNNTSPDPDLNRRIAKRGAIIAVMPTGHPWRAEVDSGKFGFVETLGIEPEETWQFIRQWRRIVNYETLAHSNPLDSYTLRLYTMFPGKDDRWGVKLETVSSWIARFGGTVDSHTTNGVTFTITVFGLVTSPEFWDVPSLDGVVFNEVGYDPGTGRHEVGVDYSRTGITPEKFIEKTRTQMPALLLSHNSRLKTARLEVYRTDAMRHLNDAVQKTFSNLLLRKQRFRFREAVCAAADIAPNKRLVLTADQVRAAVIDAAKDDDE